MNIVVVCRLVPEMFLFVFAACFMDSMAPGMALHFDYVASISEVAEGAKKIDIWIPVPQDDETQKIPTLKIGDAASCHCHQTA